MSTSYVPKSDGHVKLTMDKGRLALTKDGRTFTEEESFSTLVVCDSEANGYATKSERDLRSGRDLMTTAAVLNALLGSAPVGFVLMAIGAMDFADGQASMIDAVNRHNDADSCSTSIAQKESTQ